MDLEFESFCCINKAGTYLISTLEVNAIEVAELDYYDKTFKNGIASEYKGLISKFGLVFTTESSYIMFEEGKPRLVLCLIGDTSEDLKNALCEAGLQFVDCIG